LISEMKHIHFGGDDGRVRQMALDDSWVSSNDQTQRYVLTGINGRYDGPG